jgi:pyruvate/2-oxoglutarate dehydrogenase complex dihydrolipoamide acyltransferase (E2) component
MQVTVDVRSPIRGILRAVLVKVDDVVGIGNIVAVVDESEGAPAPAQAAGSAGAPAPARKPVDLEELSAAASEKSDSTLRGHKARIQFPPRRTPQGLQISAMPAYDQQKYIARSTSAAKESPQAAPSVTALGPSQNIARAAAAGMVAHVARRTLEDEEMETIMLGGAEP